MTAPSHTSETIERELAALGEAPPSAEELAMLAELEDHGEVASVARLTELADPLAFEDLSELETHRGWRNVEQRLARSSGEPTGEVAPSKRPTPSGGGPRRWLYAAIGVAAAAAVLFVVTRPALRLGPGKDETVADSKVDAKAVAELGEQARASLKILDNGTTDTQRAEQLAAEYQARLEEQGG